MTSNRLPSTPGLRWPSLGASAWLACSLAHADVLELKNGKVLTGKYVGGTTGTLRFETSAGTQVLRFAQLENRLDLVLRLQRASAIPLVPGTKTP